MLSNGLQGGREVSDLEDMCFCRCGGERMKGCLWGDTWVGVDVERNDESRKASCM